MVFEKLKTANLSMKKSKCSFTSKGNTIFGSHSKCYWHMTTTLQNTHNSTHESTNNTKASQSAFLRLVGYYTKSIKGFAKIAKPLTLLTRQQVKFNWTPEHQAAFIHLKDAIVQAPILHYPSPNKTYIIFTDASDDVCGAQLSQEHDGAEFPIAFFIPYFF